MGIEIDFLPVGNGEKSGDAIALRFFAGLSAREAAVAMDKQEGTIRGLQFRGIAALRRRLGLDEPTGGEPGGRIERTDDG